MSQSAAITVKAAHHRVVSNMLFNSAGNIVSALVGFLLAPVMVHTLGDAGYGIWAVALQFGAYLGLMDVGIRVAVGRYLTYHHARNERDQIDLIVTSAIGILSLLGLLCALAGCALAVLLPRMVHIPPGMVSASRWTILLTSLVVGLSFPSSIFPCTIASLSRYDLLNLRTASVVVIRGIAMWIALLKGGGIVGIAVVWLAVTLGAFALDYAIATRLYDGFHFRTDLTEIWLCTKKLFAFSAFAFLLAISSRLLLWSDNVVIAVILGPAAVTAYVIGSNLVDFSRNALASITMGFVPLATAYDAKGDLSSLRQLLVRGSRLGLLLVLPGIMAFFIIGKDFIGLWMGSRYEQTAGTVLILLAIAMLVAPLQVTCNQILYGMNKHRFYAFLSGVEAIANLGLSILLAFKIGVVGVAWGSMVPAVIVEGILVPGYTARLLNHSKLELYWQAWLQPILSSIPYCAVLLLLHHFGWVRSWSRFILTVALGVGVYATTVWFWTLSQQERVMVASRLKSREAATENAGSPFAPAIAFSADQESGPR